MSPGLSPGVNKRCHFQSFEAKLETPLKFDGGFLIRPPRLVANSRSGFKDEIERRFNCATELPETARGNYFAKARFPSLRTQPQPNFL